MSCIFLETTIQIDRVLGAEARRAAIELRLVGQDLITSTYVRMEFNRTVVDDFMAVHAAVLAEQRPSDAMLRLRQSDRRFRPRSLDRCLRIWGLLLDQFEDEPLAREKVLEVLETWIEELLPRRFMAGVNETLNATDCDLPRDKLRFEGDRYRLQVTCRRERARCRLPDLLQENQTSLETCQPQLTASSDRELRLAGKIIAAAKNNWQIAKGQQNCWRMADLIITLEAPADAAIYTTNRKHFEPLCVALGKQLLEEEE